MCLDVSKKLAKFLAISVSERALRMSGHAEKFHLFWTWSTGLAAARLHLTDHRGLQTLLRSPNRAVLGWRPGGEPPSGVVLRRRVGRRREILCFDEKGWDHDDRRAHSCPTEWFYALLSRVV